jgi:undecaprenyl-phosphate 4-deoxy-4-formamido-L-arabinose transferase
LVNDGSADRSWEKIKDLSLNKPNIRGINLMRNFGQHNALLCGIRAAKYEFTITMDDDLQHPPEEIHKLLAALTENVDVVYGYPEKLPHSFWRNLSSKITKRILAYLMGIRSAREISAFRVFRTDLRRVFQYYRDPSVILDVLLSWGTSRFTFVLVKEDVRKYGKSNYKFTNLIKQALLVFTGFSILPLRLSSWLGFFFVIFGLAVFLYVFISYLSAGSIPGFPFLASIISIFSGAQLFVLGIMGEYLGRIFERSMGRPNYIVGQTVNFPETTIQGQ